MATNPDLSRSIRDRFNANLDTLRNRYRQPRDSTISNGTAQMIAGATESSAQAITDAVAREASRAESEQNEARQNSRSDRLRFDWTRLDTNRGWNGSESISINTYLRNFENAWSTQAPATISTSTDTITLRFDRETNSSHVQFRDPRVLEAERRLHQLIFDRDETQRLIGRIDSYLETELEGDLINDEDRGMLREAMAIVSRTKSFVEIHLRDLSHKIESARRDLSRY